MRDEIFAPLGMTQTDFEPTPRIRAHLATGYTVRDGKIDAGAPTREHAGRGYKVPNGAMYTTVGDLAKFLIFQLGHGPEVVLARDALGNRRRERDVGRPGQLAVLKQDMLFHNERSGEAV